ncbi:MAG: VWA domain-containing protein [Thermoanaerobaculia bacterium]
MALPCPPLRRPRSRPGTLGRTVLALLLVLLSAGAALAISEEELEPEFRAWLDEVGPLITKAERTAFLNLEKDYQREAFIERFWQARDPYPDTARNEMREAWETRVEEARLYFGSTKEERAKLYLLNGAPAGRFEGQCAATTWPIEVWAYTRSERIKEDVIFFVFYRPFNQGPFRLWYPYDGISVLMQFPRPGTPDQQLLYELADSCIARDDIPTAIAAILRRGRMDFERWLEMALEPPPPVSPEWVSTFNSYSTDVPPDAAQLAAELTVAFPGRRQSRTVVQGLLAVDAAKAKLSDVAGAQSYNFLLNGEILLGRKLFDSFRYKFDLPADTVTGPTIPLVFERFLRPGKYTMILKLEDTIGGGFFRKMMEIDIPTVEGPMPMAVDAESALLFEEANAALSTLDNTIRLVRPHGDIQAGLVRFDTLITGNAISSVRFHLDGRPLLTKNKPPYSVELDLGQVPRTRVLRVEGFDKDDREIAWDEIQVNASSHRFRARLIEPRRKAHYEKSLRAEAEVEVPEDESLDHVEFYLNETLVATLYQAPFTQPIVLPPNGQVAYVRVVAYLVDGNSTEDLVFINAPENLEEIDVQFVELFTTVLDRSNHPVTDLEVGDFSVSEDGVPQTIARFEKLDNLPIHAAILLDVSASMEPNLDAARAAALEFYEKRITPKDRGALIVFNDRPQLAVKLTNKIEKLAGGLAGLKAERGTALYDSVVFSLFYFNGVKGQRALIVLSDGKDEGSRFSIDETLDFARRAGVAIYTIGLGIPRGESETRKVLKRLAEETGGRSFQIKEASELAPIYDALQQELRSRYLLAYQSTNQSRENRFREVDVKVGGFGLEAKTLRGYYP